uniref:CCDC66 domain-containing protein n=1 Tax=Ascaris lumbricoides TaxID=6252 RepID=A0A0M3I4N2_ASCLU
SHDSLFLAVTTSETTVTASSFNIVDPAEQHKRDLLKQIEDNKRRKEEERQRELEMERKEEARFEEYRRKLQQEVEEEERKTREKALAAERNAARIRALQVNAETTGRRSHRRYNGNEKGICQTLLRTDS